MEAAGEDTSVPTVGVGVAVNGRGEIVGTKLLMCGKLPEVKLNTSDLFLGCPCSREGCVPKGRPW